MSELDLTVKGLALGTHETPWNLQVLLYKGATSVRRDVAIQAISDGKFRDIVQDRLPFIIRLHEVLKSYVSKGSSQQTLRTYLERIWSFYSWIDITDMPSTEKAIIPTFKAWTEHLLNRVKVNKDIAQMTAYKRASIIANLIAKALDLPGAKPGHSLMLTTRLKRPKKPTKVLSTKADKQNLVDTFEFGHTLTTICNHLDIKTVRGSLPIEILLNENKFLTVAGNLIDPYLDVSTIENSGVKKRAIIARQPLAENISLLETHKRSSILNLRIESELLIFIAQTGMNLSQAVALSKSTYRWQSDGEDYEVFRVYKGRREGEAIFRCYKAYRDHLQTYLDWLDETELSQNDERLFPMMSRGMIRTETSKVSISTLKKLFKKHGLIFINPTQLRNTRINWLLRQTDDLNLTAEQMGHTTEVLLKDYLRPHHQRASSEIIEFHNLIDPAQLAPGPGLCVDSHQPKQVVDFPENAPKPDCISPEGCLFCEKHRDVMSSEYCWKLASHLQLKRLETNLYKPSEHNHIHPGNRVMDRITSKLKAISDGSEIRNTWVKDAQNSIRSGKYHPAWDGYIRLLEVMV